MKVLSVVFTIILCVGFIVGCGNDDGPIILKPDPIPKEYQGMSLGTLTDISEDLSYAQILGSTRADYSGGSDPKIEDSIMKRKGELFSDSGVVESIYASSEPGVFTLWVCSVKGVEIDATFSSHSSTGKNCIDPLFLLYELDRGPELKKGVLIRMVGVVVGTRKKPGTNPDGGQGAGGKTARTLFIVPSISVIKAEINN